MTSKKVWEVLADQDAGKTIPELMGENDALIADFYKACDQFIESFDQVIERERVRHDELMRELRREDDDPLDGNPYDMDAHEIATTNEPTEVEEDE